MWNKTVIIATLASIVSCQFGSLQLGGGQQYDFSDVISFPDSRPQRPVSSQKNPNSPSNQFVPSRINGDRISQRSNSHHHGVYDEQIFIINFLMFQNVPRTQSSSNEKFKLHHCLSAQ